MSLYLLNQICIALFATLLIAAIVEDLIDYRIPNFINLSLFLIYPVYVISSPVDVYFWWSIGLATFFFIIGLGLFSAGIMGGGDVKLIALTVLWVGPGGLIPFLLVMGMVGGAMSLFMMSGAARHGAACLCVHMGLTSVQEKILTDKLAYGVAIGAGGLFAAFQLFVN